MALLRGRPYTVNNCLPSTLLSFQLTAVLVSCGLLAVRDQYTALLMTENRCQTNVAIFRWATLGVETAITNDELTNFD